MNNDIITKNCWSGEEEEEKKKLEKKERAAGASGFEKTLVFLLHFFSLSLHFSFPVAGKMNIVPINP